VRRAQTAVTAQSGTLLRTALILLTAAAMTRAWFQVSLMTYLPVWIESAGGTVAQASRLLAVFAFAIGGGAMFGGTVSDRVGPWRVVVISFLLIAPAYWLFLHSSGPLQYLVLALIGFAIGNTYPTFVIMAQDCWTQRAAVASGLIMGIGWAPGGLGASFTGYLADLSTLDYSLQFLVVPPLLGLACMVGWRWVVRHHSV
jgi:FSR family fosmidomycin resistance protein-like MFS transporter